VFDATPIPISIQKTPHILAQKSPPVDSPKGSFSSTTHGLLGVFLVDLLERQVYGSHIKMTYVSATPMPYSSLGEKLGL
jgi:hypothetical protein